jgi:agmatinase
MSGGAPYFVRPFLGGSPLWLRPPGRRYRRASSSRSRGVGWVVEQDARLRGAKVYVSFDIDAVDPAYAPGTGTPEVGGLTSFEALSLVRGLQGLDFVGFDLVEVAPQYDGPGRITALLAANLLFEFLSLIALGR